MSLTLSCKLADVFVMICAVSLQNQVQDSVVRNPACSVAPIESRRYDRPTSAVAHYKRYVQHDWRAAAARIARVQTELR